MVADAARLRALMQSVTDGEAVNWDAVSAGANETQQRLIRELRLVAKVAEVHRTAGAEPDDLSEDSTYRIEADDLGRDTPLGRWGGLALLEKIGEGAFGEVYRARDPWLKRDVALKLLKSSVAHRVSPDRMIREGQTLARVKHANVVTVYGADRHDGRAGLSMELVRGRTLGQILAVQGPFSASEATMIGRDLCRALSAVHAAGLIHGDVKAQNVMRESGGRLLLMDFGSGGTPIYLAPEVLEGGQATVASDIYALGVLLFQLVTGRYPITSATAEGLKQAHLNQVRARLSDLRPDLPDEFVAVVDRAIHPDPSRRFETARDMRVALTGEVAPNTPVPLPAPAPWWRTPFAAAAVLLVAATVFTGFLAWRAPVVVPPDVPRSVAVVPFRAIGSDPDTVYYSDGLSEDLTAQLAGLASVQVVSGASMRVQAATLSPAAIGDELDVDALVTGSVRLSADTIRVVVEVVDTHTAKQLWANVFDRPRHDIVAIQAEVVRQVAMALKGGLTPEDRIRLQRPSMEPQAFELYLKGRYYWNTRSPDGLRRSVTLFNEAIAIDPDAALPYAGLADAHMLMAFYYLDRPANAHARAEAAAREALRLDPDLAQVHAAIGSLRLCQFRWAESETAFQRAIALNPSYAAGHHWYALLLAQQGRFDAAIAAMQTAREIDPASHVLRSAMAYIFYSARDYERALHEYQQVLDVDPAFFPANAGIADILAARGEYEPALAALEEAKRRTGRTSDLNLSFAYVYALAGRHNEARRLLRLVESELDQAAATSRADIGAVYAVLGDMPLAFEWLDRAVEDGDTQLGYLGIEPRFDALRGQPGFEALMATLGIKSR